MVLFIDTTQTDRIIFSLFDNSKIIAKINKKTEQRKSEQCLFLFDKILKKSKKKIQDLKGVAVMNKAGTFSDVRLGVMLANCLAWSLKIPVVDLVPSDFDTLNYSVNQLRKIILNKINRVKTGQLIKPLYTKEPNIILSSKMLNLKSKMLKPHLKSKIYKISN